MSPEEGYVLIFERNVMRKWKVKGPEVNEKNVGLTQGGLVEKARKVAV